VQLAAVAYDPLAFVPTQAEVEGGHAFVKAVGAMAGDVYVPTHNYLASLAGKRSYAHEMAIGDVLGAGGRPGAELREEIQAAIKQRRFAAVIVDTDFFRREIEESYRLRGNPMATKDGLTLETGWRVRPRALYVPK
jgi:hypothetical protein